MEKLNLEKDQIILFRKRIASIHCKDGILWIHWKRGEDIQLQHGESLDCGRFSLVQIHALKGSIIEVKPASLAVVVGNLLKGRSSFGGVQRTNRDLAHHSGQLHHSP